MEIKKLSTEEMTGQRFIFGVNNHNVSDIIRLIKDYHIGGVILYKQNYQTYDEMLQVIKKMKDANKGNKIPLFVSIDQEGGRVNRIPDAIHNIKNIYDVSKTNEKLVKYHANAMGKLLHKTGINMDFAPVLDIYNNSKSNVLYKRCFYGDANDVHRLGKIYVDEMRKNKVLAVVKHFPGHGTSKHDSHFFIPYITNTEELFKKHIVPFKKIIKDGVDGIMIGHLIIKGRTRLLPASISGVFLREYLRDIGYDNLIITDEINMLKRHLIYRFNYVEKAIKTPADIILVKIKDYNEGVKIIKQYERMLLKDGELKDILRDNVKRIVRVKEYYKINDDTDYEGVNITEINKVIDEVNAKVN